jgi:hypothetical protein
MSSPIVHMQFAMRGNSTEFSILTLTPDRGDDREETRLRCATGDQQRVQVVHSHHSTYLLTFSPPSQSPTQYSTCRKTRDFELKFVSRTPHPDSVNGNALSVMSQANQDNRSATEVNTAEAVPMDEDTFKVEEEVKHTTVPEPRVCPAFSDTSANVVFKSSDGVIFYVDDYHLKSNRWVFPDQSHFQVAIPSLKLISTSPFPACSFGTCCRTPAPSLPRKIPSCWTRARGILKR